MRMRYLKHTHPAALGLALLAGCLYTGSAFAVPVVPPDVVAQFQAQQAGARGKSLTKAATVPGPGVHYYNGNSRVDLVLALDELQIDDPASSPKGSLRATAEADAALATGAAAAAEVDGDSTRLHVRFNPESDVASLKETAARLASLQTGRTVSAVLYRRADSGRGQEDRIAVTPRFSLKLDNPAALNGLLKKYGARVVEKVSYSPNTYILEATSGDLLAGLDVANAIYENEKGIAFATPLLERRMSKRFVPNDTLYSTQWHLKNTGAQVASAVAGADINVEGAWDTATGTGVNIAITDDGVQVAHPDLSSNARTDIDIDLNDSDSDPSPVPSNGDGHGNSCAGVAAARGNNSLGVTGSAPNAGLVGIRLLGAAFSDAQEAQAMSHQMSALNADRVHINSNSWGPNDDGATLETFGPLMGAALQNGVTNGRGGLGTIFVWAAGNGRCDDDNANYDGYASSRYTIAIGATGANAKYSYYSEPGASMVVNTPSNYRTTDDCNGNASAGITTTDLVGTDGYNAVASPTGDYTNNTGAVGFGGTSSATPLAAGVIALMLQTNPNLGWRDVQNILINTATKNDPTDLGWVQNGDGRWFNHSYGYGRINASAAVLAASAWSNLPPNATPLTVSHTADLALPDNNATGVSDTVTISGQDAFVIEHVEVTFNATHTYRGDIGIVLESPSGMKSTLTALHNDSGDNYSNWIFTSIAHWGEHPNGTWKIYVSDLFAEDTGTFNNWTLTLHGRTVATPTPTASQTPTPSPSASISPTASIAPTASSTATPSPTASFTPSLTASPTATASATATASPTTSPSPSPTASPSPSATETETPTASPSPSPTPIPNHVDFDFVASEQGWEFFNPSTFATVTGAHDHEAGTINSVLTENINSFAYWESPTFLISPDDTLPAGTLGENVIPITGVVGPSSLYRSAFTVKGDASNAATVPTIRVRSSAFNFEQSDVLVITSAGNGNLSPTVAGKAYIQYFSQPAAVDSFRLDFDVLNFDPADASNATLALDAVTVDSLGVPPGGGTAVTSLDFSASTQGFTARNAAPLLEAPARFLTDGGGLGIRGVDPVRSLIQIQTLFGYWGAETNVPVIGGKLYAFTFRVTSDASAEQRAQVPTFRMRINDSSLKLSAYMNIDSRDNATRVPVDGNSEDYVLWVQVPPEVDGQTLIFSFDYLWTSATDDNPGITLTLQNLSVAYYELTR